MSATEHDLANAPIATAADIAQIYDAYAKLPKPDPADPNPTPILPDPANAPEGVLPAALEFDGAHGRIIMPLEAVPSESLLQHPAVAAFGDAIQTIKLEEQADGDWVIYLQGADIHSGVTFALSKAEVDAMLLRDGIVLHGRPSDDELAALRAANKAAADAEADAEHADAPPF